MQLAGLVSKFPTSLLGHISTAKSIVFEQNIDQLDLFSELDHKTLSDFSKKVESYVIFLTGKSSFKFPELDRRVKLPSDLTFNFEMLEKCGHDSTLLKLLFKILSDVDWAKAVKYLAHNEGLSVTHWLADDENDNITGRIRTPHRKISALKRDGKCEFLKDDHRLYTEGLMFVEKVYLLEFLF